MAIIYATPADVATYMGVNVATLPSDILTLIARAQDFLDYVSLNKIHDVWSNSTNTAITDTEIAGAMKNATCAEVQYWILTDPNFDVINNGNITGFGIGNFSMSYGADGSGGNAFSVLAPRANRALFLAGLLYRGVSSNAGYTYRTTNNINIEGGHGGGGD
jgi:hypothetical protein